MHALSSFAARTSRRPLASVARVLVLAAATASCGGDGATGPRELPDTGCRLSLASGTAAGQPGQAIVLSGMAATVPDSTLAAWVTVSGDATKYPTLVARDSGGTNLRVTVPFHPRGVAQGGTVALTVEGKTAGTTPVACTGPAITIQAPTAAAGTATQVATSLDATMGALAGAFGVTAAQLASADSSQIPASLRPLASAAWVLDGAGNPNSLRHVADGTAPVLGGRTVDAATLDAVLAATGALPLLQQMAADLAKLGPRPSDTPAAVVGVSSVSAALARGDTAAAVAAGAPRLVMQSTIVPRINTPEQLDFYMRFQAELTRTADRAQDVMNKLGVAVALGGVFSGPGAVIGTLVGGELYVMTVLADGLQHTLPSKLNAMSMDVSQTSFNEDMAGPARWSNVQLTAQGMAWQFSVGQIVNGVLVGAGGAMGRYFNNAFKGSALSKASTDALSEVFNQFWGQVIGTLGGAVSGGVLVVDAPAYGPVNVSDAKYTTAFASTNGVITVNPTSFGYFNVAGAGSTQLVVRTRPELFAGQQAEARTVIKVSQISVVVDPANAEVRPGGSRVFGASVSGAEDPSVTWSATGGSFDSPGGGLTTWTAPQAEGTYTITATHATKRNRSGSVQVTVVNKVVVSLTPPSATVAPGATQQFTATVDGASNSAVQWTATRGTVTPDGLYTAPADSGSDMVFVKSVQDPTATASASVHVVKSTTDATHAFSVGDGMSCGITSAAKTYCWGYFPNGQTPQLRDVGQPFTSVSVAAAGITDRGCGLAADGYAYCWGAASGLYDTPTGYAGQPLAIGGPRFVALETGSYGVCGLTADGSPYCWTGRLGSTTAALVPGGVHFASISVGSASACGLTAAGAAYCWGTDNSQGKLGSGATDQVQQDAPVAVAGGLTFRSIQVGVWNTCAITTADALYCWGDNSFAQFGNGTRATGTYAYAPVPAGNGLRFANVAVARTGNNPYNTCGVTTDGAGWCWGYDNTPFGGTSKLGSANPPGDYALVPQRVDGGLTFAQIGISDRAACGLTTTGSVYCWGAKELLAFGTGETAGYTLSPVPAATGFTFVTPGR